MMKGICFDEIHSYRDLNLVLSQVSIPPAVPKTTYIDIPGGDGAVDLTEASGEVKYKNRECSFTFTVFPYEDFEEKKREISNILNGKRCKITVDKDPNYYWLGRCKINEYASDRKLHKIVVGATVAPYKLKTKETRVRVSGGTSLAVELENSRKSVIPTITTMTDATLVFDGKTYNLGSGDHTLLDFKLTYGKNQVTVTSNAAVTFKYQEGDL